MAEGQTVITTDRSDLADECKNTEILFSLSNQRQIKGRQLKMCGFFSMRGDKPNIKH